MNEDDDDLSDDDDAELEEFLKAKSSIIGKPVNKPQQEEEKQSSAPTTSKHQVNLQSSADKKKWLDNLSSDSSDGDVEEFMSQLSSIKKDNSKSGQKFQKSNSETFEDTGSSNKSSIISQSVQEEQLKWYKGDILEVVDKNEKMNEAVPEKMIEQANTLLQMDNKYYNVQKKLLQVKDCQRISKRLFFDKDNYLSGIPSCILHFQNYIFIGNSQGIIRLFEIESEKEQNPLMDPQLENNKVTCMHVSSDCAFLVAGHKSGALTLWDLQKYKLVKVCPAYHDSQISAVRIYYVSENETVYVTSAEDNGKVQLIEFEKKSFFGYSGSAQYLFKERLKGTAAISIMEPSGKYKNPKVDNAFLCAYGSLNEVIVVSLKPIKEVFKVNRPAFCREKSLPYVDFGYGLTPINREKTMPMMAFAWDRLVQLVYFDDDGRAEMDGYYYSDQEVTNVYFIGESILAVIVNSKEIKILYTTKFHTGMYKYLENAKRDNVLNNAFETIVSLTAHSELEKGTTLPDLKKSVVESATTMNLNQTVCKYKHTLSFLCQKKIIIGKLFTWKEYIEHVKYVENYDWLTVLKVALEIYNGDIKGFAKVPDEKDARESMLKNYMKEMIKDSIGVAISRFNQGSPDPKQKSNFEADSIAIRVAIEFCLSIQATFFLFSDIFNIFKDQGLEEKFILNLEPFIISGQFRKEIVPEGIVYKLIKYYESQGKLLVLEKIIQHLDFTDYHNKEELVVICQTNYLVSGLLYLMTSSGEIETEGCMQVLNTLYKLYKSAENIIDKEEIFTISQCSKDTKYKIQKSKVYLGYKLMWTMKMSLEGKTFPAGNLTDIMWRNHTYDIVNFTTTDDYLIELLELDAEQFFKIVFKLFSGWPIEYLKSQRQYSEQTKGRLFDYCKMPDGIIRSYHRGLSLLQENQQEIATDKFAVFIVKVLADSDVEITHELGLEMFTRVLKKDLMQQDQEQVILRALKSKSDSQGKKLMRLRIRDEKEIETILSVLDSKTILPKVKIYFMQKKKDYREAFNVYLRTASIKKDIFGWVNATLEKLEQSQVSMRPFEKLKETVENQMRDLAKIDTHQTIVIVDRWFEDKQERFIKDLSEDPEKQLEYLQSLILSKQQDIEQTIHESQFQADKREQGQVYREFLVLHTQLLCQLKKPDVEKYVSQEFYPVEECLKICTQFKIDKAIAVLEKRNGNYTQAIKRYGYIWLSLKVVDLLSDLIKNNDKQFPQFLEVTRAFKHLQEFDFLLEKAINICEKYEQETGDEGWFLIIEATNQYIAQVNIIYKQQEGKDIEREDSDRLVNFVLNRKDEVFKRLPTSVEMNKLMQRLKLEFPQVKKLYDLRSSHLLTEEKYLNFANKITVQELVSLQETMVELMDNGYSIEAGEKCALCTVPLGQDRSRYFRVFQCGHAYHVGCLQEKMMEKFCTLCQKQDLCIEFVDENKKKSNLRKQQRRQKEDEASSPAYSSPIVERLQSSRGMTIVAPESLIMRQLEQFDKNKKANGLQRSSFNK